LGALRSTSGFQGAGPGITAGVRVGKEVLVGRRVGRGVLVAVTIAGRLRKVGVGLSVSMYFPKVETKIMRTITVARIKALKIRARSVRVVLLNMLHFPDNLEVLIKYIPG
jgi:hypothetical protein